MGRRGRWNVLSVVVWAFAVVGSVTNASEFETASGFAAGPSLWVVVEGPQASAEAPISDLLLPQERRVIFCCASKGHALLIREELVARGWLGSRAFVLIASPDNLPLADGLADFVIANGTKRTPAVEQELRRIAHAGSAIVFGDERIVVARPRGSDDWSHPYHGPDNNPRSLDRNVEGPYLTQFLSEPWYVPMPQVTVASGGRIFKAFGHIALKQREWPWLNKLVAINGYNGLLLWQRELTPGFNIHRNTMIATPKRLFIADNDACHVLDAATGKLLQEIRIPTSIDADGSWKWMALQDGILYALIGRRDLLDQVIQGDRRQPGWPWKDLGEAYAGRVEWGFGRTVVALRLGKQPQVVWSYREEEPIDSRAMCMADGKLYVYCHGKSLTCLDVKTGERRWRTTDAELLGAIGKHDHAQTPPKGFSTSAYAKAGRHGVFFAGPQRSKLVAVSADDGSLMWSYPHGNFQLVLRDDGLYAMGRLETSKVFDYRTGKVLSDLDCFRGNCTRATATLDTIFTRGYRHTGTMQLDVSLRRPRRIPLMRPACQDGVIIADGRLYWGPWMCDCNHSLIGLICLAPTRVNDDTVKNETSLPRLRRLSAWNEGERALESDWPHYRHDVERRSVAAVSIPRQITLRWKHLSPTAQSATAPIAVGATVYVGYRDGRMVALDRNTGKLKWMEFTAGPILFPPEYDRGHLYVGSGDGYVTAWNAERGEQVWQFRAAPAERRILVHGSLMSNWPVGSGVLVDAGNVYAAAGITSYDGTHVWSLNAQTGKPRWHNDSSGRLAGENELTGVSVQGHLLKYADRLYLAGGNVVSPAVYDLQTGACFNKLTNPWVEALPAGMNPLSRKNPRDPYLHAPRGRELFVVDGEVRVFDELLYTPPTYMQSRYHGGHFLQAGKPGSEIRATHGRVVRLLAEKEKGRPRSAWQTALFADPMGLAVAENAVVVVGELAKEKAGSAQASTGSGTYAVVVLDRATGKESWRYELPERPVPWGIALTRDGEMIVSLRNGTVCCFGAAP